MSDSGSSRRLRIPQLAVIAAILLIVGVFSLYLFGTRSNLPPPPPIPNPNGYETLVEAALKIRDQESSEYSDYFEGDLDSLRIWVDANPEIVPLLREGLQQPSAVPLSYDRSVDLTTLYSQDLRGLSRFLVAHERVAWDGGNTDDAIELCFLGIDVARHGTRHGLLVQYLIGIAVEDLAGLESLRRFRTQLSAEQSRTVAQRLLELDEERITAAEAFAFEDSWRIHSQPQGERLRTNLIPGYAQQLFATRNSAEESIKKAGNRISSKSRLLAITLAIRAYQLEGNGSLPTALADLTPQYLSQVPLDPFANRSFKYAVSEDGASFTLYSVGPDGVDNGGRPTPPETPYSEDPGFDFLLDPSPAAPSTEDDKEDVLETSVPE